MDNIQVVIPKEAENLQLPDPGLKDFYEDLNNRVVWLDSEVDEDCLSLIKYILKWNKEDIGIPSEKRKPVKIFFFSPGGDLDVNNALIDIISLSLTPIWGINMGRCFSAAAYIFLSCHRRFTLAQSQFLLHQGSGTFSGTYQEVLPQVLAYQTRVEELTKFVQEHTSYTEDEIADNITSDWYIDVAEGLEKGIYTDKLTNLATILDN